MQIGRNDPCPCGSGKKYKQCHLGKIPLTSKDLLESLKEQISFLRTSATLFDSGQINEAKRIASTLRILLHETKNSKSLMRQIDPELKYLNTAEAILDNGIQMFRSALTTQQISVENGESNFQFLPALENFRENRPWTIVDFQSWWDQIVLVDQEGLKYSRSELVLHTADTDGGAHVDPSQDEGYYKMSRSNVTGMQTYTGNPWEPETMRYKDIESKPHLPALRQIAFEFLKSLERVYSEL